MISDPLSGVMSRELSVSQSVSQWSGAQVVSFAPEQQGLALLVWCENGLGASSQSRDLRRQRSCGLAPPLVPSWASSLAKGA